MPGSERRHGVEFRLGAPQQAEDLLAARRQTRAVGRQSHPAPDVLHEHRTSFLLEPTQVVRDRRLPTPERGGGRAHRSFPGERDERFEAFHLHPLNLSASSMRSSDFMLDG